MAGFKQRVVKAWTALTGQGPAKRDAFKGGELNRLTSDWVTRPMAADDELRWSLPRLRARGREMSRNSAIARQYLNLLAVSVIGPVGFTFQGRVRNNDGRLARLINERIEEAWEEWSECVTLDRRLSLTQLSQLLIRTVAFDGEAFVLIHRRPDLPFALVLEPLDADLVDDKLNIAPGKDQNEIRMGVEVDAENKRVAYHIWSKPETMTYGGRRERKRIPADRIIHLYDPLRVNQTRGVTWFAPIMLPLRMLDGFVEAALVAARSGAAQMGIWVRKDATDAGNVNPGASGDYTMEANPGTFDFAPDGYDLSSWTPNQPNAAFPEFVKAALRQIACGLGVSYTALANDLEGVNYSSIRSGMLIERDVWRALQQWWTSSFLCPVYREWVSQSILSGALVLDTRDPRRFLEHKFTGRGWQWVDPLKDTQAGELGIKNGLTSRTRLLNEQGVDFEDVLEELADEEAMSKEMGVGITPAPAKVAGPNAQDPNAENPAADPAAEEPVAGGKNGNGMNGNGRRLLTPAAGRRF